MLSIYEKVLELVVKKQIEIFQNNNDIITEHQSEFRNIIRVKQQFKPSLTNGN